MSEHIRKFLASELKLIRICCPACGCVAELPINGLTRQDEDCRICKHVFGVKDMGKALGDLGVALQQLAAAEDKVKVEFVLPGE